MQELCHVAAREHIRGIDNLLIQFVNIDQALIVASRLRAYGYNKVKLFKAKEKSHDRVKE